MHIGCVLVSYNPNIDLLRVVINSLISQVDEICVVDNGSTDYSNIEKTLLGINDNKVNFIKLGENTGIAHATNVGLEYFKKKSFDFVLTSDQDSVYPDNYILKFKESLDKHCDNINNIAAFTPVFFDENENQIAPIIIKTKNFMRKVLITEGECKVFQAIASGMVINLAILDEVGNMDENLFIDWVDLEWCWRANFYQKSIICNAEMCIKHRLGDYSKDVGNRKVSLRSYIRNYYITRNSFYLAIHTKYLKRVTKILLFFKSFQYIFGYTILSKDHKNNLKYTLKGFIDAIKGKMGKIVLKN